MDVSPKIVPAFSSGAVATPAKVRHFVGRGKNRLKGIRE
jgi:hypothetical protein